MLATLVYIHVKAECVEAFKGATLENARNSVKEPGVARFDMLQQAEDPARFTLVEVYRTAGAPAQHKETAHYKLWRDTVADMMAEPRLGVRHATVFPDESGW